MQPRRHRMRQRQRRDSAAEWIRTSHITAAAVTVGGYAKRYGVDRYTAYAELTALGVVLPDAARRWAQRPPATPRPGRRRATPPAEDVWTGVDGRVLFVVGYTAGGAPYGVFADELPADACWP